MWKNSITGMEKVIIERKQVHTGDLIDSIRFQGRLDKQLKKLVKVFKTVIVLIEYNEKIKFNLDVWHSNIYFKNRQFNK